MLSFRRSMRALALVALLWVIAAPLTRGWCGARSVSSRHFPEPASLAPRVKFWERVFTQFSEYQVVLHDAGAPGRVFSVLDFRPQKGRLPDVALDRLIAGRVSAEKKRIRRLLREVAREHRSRKGMGKEEKRLLALFSPNPSSSQLRAAARRVRAQRGLREKFAAGLARSRAYLPRMRAILRAEGVPDELVWLPLIESAFDPAAHSKAGAAGIWQFMPGTGRRFILVDRSIDERWDPVASTRAAAQLLKQNFKVLRSWPLAITAYNHGRAGMLRAVARTGSRDIGVIVERYRGRLFGFASQNFYPEFLAALRVQRDYRIHFAGISFAPGPRADEVVLERAIRVRDAARLAGIGRKELARLNPALRPPLFKRNGWVPAGYALWVPRGNGLGFELRYANLPASRKRRSPSLAALRKSAAAGHRVHRVREGQTLSQIARLYGTSVAKIKSRNRIRNVHRIRAGQVLKIPTG